MRDRTNEEKIEINDLSAKISDKVLNDYSGSQKRSFIYSFTQSAFELNQSQKLIFSHNHLGHFYSDNSSEFEFWQLFDNPDATFTELSMIDLSKNDLHLVPLDQLIIGLKLIPYKNGASMNLAGNNLFHQLYQQDTNYDALITFIKNSPIQTFDLSNNLPELTTQLTPEQENRLQKLKQQLVSTGKTIIADAILGNYINKHQQPAAEPAPTRTMKL